MKPEPQVQLIRTIPARTGYWIGSPQFGAKLPFEASSNNRQKILYLPDGYLPQVWTVSLGIDFSDAAMAAIPAGSQGLIVQAEVTIGTGAASQTFLLDWKQGTTFSVVASAISIDAVYSEFFPAFTLQAPSDLELSALVGRGGTHGRCNATLTAARQSVTNNATVAPARIPKFASRLFALPAPLNTADDAFAAAQNIFVSFRMGPNPASNTVSFLRLSDYVQAMAAEGIPVPAAASYFSFSNVGAGIAGASLPIVPVFALAL